MGVGKDVCMRSFRSPRVVAACALALAWLASSIHAADRSPTAMADAANAFLASLSPVERQAVGMPFDSSERERWGFVPTEMFPRKGLTIGAMSEPQRDAARHLLRSGLSQQGYLTATAIMQLEDVLRAIENAGGGDVARGRRMERNPLKYFVSIFGTPGPRGAWSWRVEGHHVSLNFTIVNGTMVAATPQFFGSNPAEVREGPQQGLRILAAEEDSGRALLESLDPVQRRKAIMDVAAPNDIVTGNRSQIDPLAPAGISGSELTPAQRDLLMGIVNTYTSAMAADIAADRLAKLRGAGIEKIAFAWAGGTTRPEKHYYRLQGPTFLVEFDNTQDDANHIHSVWRDFDGDFGRDILREHIAAAH
jgi:hypothetical protein